LKEIKFLQKWLKKSPLLYAERFALVDAPDEYYIIAAFIDLFEFMYFIFIKQK
jgi:hypothetical protein